jgi:DnaK suppressor protein
MAKNREVLVVSSSRIDELRAMLDERRRQILQEVHKGVRTVSENARAGERPKVDSGNSEVPDIQDDIALQLIQIKAESLSKISEAMERLERGTYGICGACGEKIPTKRLTALPFAVRCVRCERENEVRRVHGPHTSSGDTRYFRPRGR